MLKKLSFVVLITCLSACAKKAPVTNNTKMHAKTQQSAATDYIQMKKSLPSVSKFAVNGRVDVSLHSGFSKSPNIILAGYRGEVERVKIYMRKGVMHINAKNERRKSPPLKLTINANQLRGFTYTGNGEIRGAKLNSPFLSIALKNGCETYLKGNLGIRTLNVDGPGPVKIAGINSKSMDINMDRAARVMLTGQANLSHVNVKGQGHLSFYWVDSRRLTLHAANHAMIRLAGVADVLDVELWNHAKFEGRFLRAKSSFVKTHEHAVAEISTLNKQHSLAMDASNIYYYQVPAMQSNLMAEAGSVLDMRNKGFADLEEYNMYNKSIP